MIRSRFQFRNNGNKKVKSGRVAVGPIRAILNSMKSTVTTFDCLGGAVFQRNPLFVGLVDMRSLPARVTASPEPANAPAMQQALLSAVAARQAQAGPAALPLPGTRSALNQLKQLR